MAITTYTIPAEKIVHNTSVDFSSRFSIINPIHIVQYDNSLPIISVELKNDNKTYVLPTDIEVWIRWKKQDNTFVRKQALGCNSERNTAYFEITQQMVMQYGLFKPVVELIIPSVSSDPSVASSGYFSVLVDRNPIQNGDVESMTEYEDPYGNVCYTKTAIDDMLIEKADKATTLAGYGITDTYTKNEVDKELSAKSDLFLKRTKNLIKLSNIDTIINGLQITINNNHIKLKGTATSAITSWISTDMKSVTYESGVTYTGSAQNVIVNQLESGAIQSATGIRFHYSSGGHMSIGNADKSISFTPSSNISGDTARLSWNISAGEYDKEFDLMLEYGSTMTTFEPYYVVSNIGNHSVTYNKLNEDIQKEINSISGKAESSDLKSKITQFEFIDITTTEKGYYYGSFAHNSESNWECTSVPIPCTEGDIFRFSASMYDIDNHQHTVKCYDSSQKLVGSYCGVIEEGKSAHYNNKIFVVPEGVAYAAFNCWIAMSSVRLKVEKAKPVNDLSTQISNGLFDETPSQILYGKSIYSDGDSIADGAGSNGVSYAHLLRDKYNMTLTDESVGGTTIAVQDGRTDSIYERITSMTGDYDYILFEGGTNDVSLSIRLGEITDGVNAEFDTTTVLGALEGICQFLNTTYFDAQKLFIFVNKRVDVTFNKTNETFAKMKEVLKKWGIPYIDIGNVTNLGNWNDTVASDYFLADKLHPTLKAYKKFYLPYVEKALTFGGYINT